MAPTPPSANASRVRKKKRESKKALDHSKTLGAVQTAADLVSEGRANLMHLIAEQAYEVLRRGLTNKQDPAFKSVLHNACINNVANDAFISIIGETSRTNASRWIHAEQYPHVHVQERVLLGVAKIAEQRCRNLRKGLKEDAGLSLEDIAKPQYRKFDDDLER